MSLLSKPKFVYLVSRVGLFCFLFSLKRVVNNATIKILDYLCSWNRCHLSCDRYFKYNLLHSLNTLIWKNFKPWAYSCSFTTEISHLLGVTRAGNKMGMKCRCKGDSKREQWGPSLKVWLAPNADAGQLGSPWKSPLC